MGPVINEKAKRTILDYIETGKKEGRLIAGGHAGPGEGYFVQPTVIADVLRRLASFRKRFSVRFSP